VHSTCDCQRSDENSEHHQRYLSFPKSASANTACFSARQSLQINTERAAQHTVGVKLCKLSCLHGFSLWKSEQTKTSGTEVKAPPEQERLLLAIPPRPVCTPYSQQTLTTRHDTRMRAHIIPTEGGQVTNFFCHFSDVTPADNTTATDCTSIE